MLKGLKISGLHTWLYTDVAQNSDGHYRHNLIRQKPNSDDIESVLEELKPIVQEVHEDARFKLRSVLRDNLDPLEEWNDEIDPAEGYPELLDLTTLKGYFGEFFSGLIAENFSPFGEGNWRVPIFPFRFHETAFDQLEMYRQTGQMKRATYGRTGDDCVAFVLDGNTITKILFLEAKCTAKHDTAMIADAHTKISSKNKKPLELLRLISSLQSYKNNSEANVWIAALRKLYFSKGGFERFDCVSYVCGHSPKKPNNRISWITRGNPHENYQGGRKLEAVEIHLPEVEYIVKSLYGKEND